MKVELIYSRADWNEVLNACRTTVGKDRVGSQPKTSWRKQILLCEHSPIRKLQVTVKCYDVKSWVATHFVRHHIGVEKYVQTQRTDRTGVNRDELPQGALVTLELDLNGQAIINISRKRLCQQASPETRELWKLILEEIRKELPELYDVCVPECVYRGFCPELYSCHYSESKHFEEAVNAYRKV